MIGAAAQDDDHDQGILVYLSIKDSLRKFANQNLIGLRNSLSFIRETRSLEGLLITKSIHYSQKSFGPCSGPNIRLDKSCQSK